MTIKEIVQSTTDALYSYSDAPDLDAQRIILAALGEREPAYLIAHSDMTPDASQLQETSRMQNLRIQGMPLAYILREADFYGRTFVVTPDVLIPRPDTENLVAKALSVIPDLQAKLGRPLVIADVCTGSGCIAITLALEIPEHRYIASDISPAALAVAKQNAEQHGVTDRIEFIEGDMLSPLQGIAADLIVSNPPYVPTSELSKAGNSQETRGLLFEPRIALDGGVDGQAFVDKIKESNIPAIIETTGGGIVTNF